MNWNPTIRIFPRILPRMPQPHREALKLNAVGQGFLWLLSAILLDGGRMNTLVAIGSIAYWSAVLLILVRRHTRLSTGDLHFFRLGFALAVILNQFLHPLVSLFIRN